MALPNLPVDINWMSGISTSMYWLGYGLLVLVILGAFAAVTYLMMYKFKVTIYTVAKESDGTYRVITKKSDRGKYVMKDKVRKFRLLFNHKSLPPIPNESLWPKNNIFLLKINDDTYIPSPPKLSTNKEIQMLENDIIFWSTTEMANANKDYSKINGWDRYGNVVVMAGTVLFCLILVGVTVYYTYQHANGVTAALGGVTEALKNGGGILPSR